MSAPVGNEFWKLRSTHGRDMLFSSPTLMWDAACEYFEWCIANPIKDPRSFGGKQMIQRPFTMEGLCRYLDCNTKYFSQFKANLKDDTQGFSNIILNIQETVYQQKFENAVIGVYNTNIIARDLGLTDKQEVKQDVNVNQVFEIGYGDDDSPEEED